MGETIYKIKKRSLDVFSSAFHEEFRIFTDFKIVDPLPRYLRSKLPG